MKDLNKQKEPEQTSSELLKKITTNMESINEYVKQERDNIIYVFDKDKLNER